MCCIDRVSGLHVASLAAVLALTACTAAPSHESPAGAAVDVTTVTVTLDDVADRVEAGGVVHARESATLTSRVLAPVLDVRVVPGDRVRAGQVVVTLDTRDLSASSRSAAAALAAARDAAAAAGADLDGARAAVALATSTHERIARLHERRSATTQELDEARASLASAQARAAAASARADEAGARIASLQSAAEHANIVEAYGAILAPFAGTVTEKLVEPGNMAAPGTPLVRIDAQGPPRLDVSVDESRAALVRVGDAVEVVFADARTVDGRVREIARAVDAGSRAFVVQIALPDGVEARSGSFARARLPGGSRQVLRLPASSIVRRGQLTTVFVVEGDVARMRLVHAAGVDRERVEIAAGVQERERVVDRPSPALRDGMAVRDIGRGGRS